MPQSAHEQVARHYFENCGFIERYSSRENADPELSLLEVVLIFMVHKNYTTSPRVCEIKRGGFLIVLLMNLYQIFWVVLFLFLPFRSFGSPITRTHSLA